VSCGPAGPTSNEAQRQAVEHHPLSVDEETPGGGFGPNTVAPGMPCSLTGAWAEPSAAGSSGTGHEPPPEPVYWRLISSFPLPDATLHHDHPAPPNGRCMGEERTCSAVNCRSRRGSMMSLLLRQVNGHARSDVVVAPSFQSRWSAGLL